MHLRETPARLLTAVVMAVVSTASFLAMEAQNICSVAKTNTRCRADRRSFHPCRSANDSDVFGSNADSNDHQSSPI